MKKAKRVSTITYIVICIVSLLFIQKIDAQNLSYNHIILPNLETSKNTKSNDDESYNQQGKETQQNKDTLVAQPLEMVNHPRLIENNSMEIIISIIRQFSGLIFIILIFAIFAIRSIILKKFWKSFFAITSGILLGGILMAILSFYLMYSLHGESTLVGLVFGVFAIPIGAIVGGILFFIIGRIKKSKSESK